MGNLVRTEKAVSKKQILFGTAPQFSVGIHVASKVGRDGILLAGTPMAGNLEDRTQPFHVAETTEKGGTKGVTKVQIVTPAAINDSFILEGETFVCGQDSDAEKRIFAGKDAAEQVASLSKIIQLTYWDVEIDKDSADTLVFTQKIAETGRQLDGHTGTASDLMFDVKVVTEGQTGETTSDAVGVLLHDIDVSKGNTNGTLLIFGFVNLDRLEKEVSIDIGVKNALAGKITFLRDK